MPAAAPTRPRGFLATRTGTIRRITLGLLAAIALLLGLGVLGPQASTPADAQANLIAYHQVARWPERSGAAQGLFQTPSDLAIGRDGRVLIADPGIGGVHTLLPSGTFTTPFGVTGGFPAQLGQVGPIAVGPDPAAAGFPAGGERVYVVDPAIERVAIYSLDGLYQSQWTDIKAQSITAAADGTVYVLDRETSQIRAYDALANTEKWVWGSRGVEDGQLANFTDVSVSGDGKVLVVGDMRGQRVQLFDVATQAAIDGGAEPLKLRRVYDLRNAKFTQNEQTCSGARVNSLGGDLVFMGQGEQACLVDSRTVTFVIAASANSGTICRATVRLPTLRADTQQYFAVAEYDPNLGKCGEKRQDEPTTPVVVEYNDTSLRQVNTVSQANSNDDSKEPVLFSPRTLAMSDAEHIFVADTSSVFRVFSRDGQQVATAARDTQSGDFSTDFQLFRIDRAVSAEVVGEVYGSYFKINRSGGTGTQEAGVGRFKTISKRTQNGTEEVIEAIWSEPLVASGRRRIGINALAYNPATQELLTLRADTTDTTRSADVRIVRYAADGRKLSPDWDLPDDGRTNPYSDMVVGPDGRLYLLDDLADVVRVFGPDGQALLNVPVAFDARAVAAGPPAPDGTVFVLREPGSIERYADDGRITARLDGRPLDFSDPTTLTDLVVDGDGRVYVADGQTSLITVLEASSDPAEIPIPADGECLFKGQSAVNPTTLNLGESTTVSLALAGRCGTDEEPADVVVVVPYYRELAQGTDPSAGTITNMQRLMSRVNFARHRVGIVSYYNTTAVELPLTGDRAEYMAKTLDITRQNPANAEVKARLKNAIEEAGKLFTDPSRRRVMVLLQPNYCAVATESTPGQCAGYPPAEDAAQAIRDSGVTIVVIGGGGGFAGPPGGGGGGGGGATLLASSDEDVVPNVDAAHRRMVRYQLPAALATDLTLTDRLPANMVVDEASISGGGTWQAPDVTWTVARVDFDGLAASLSLTPSQGGTWPVSAGTQAEFTDGWGHAQEVSFPVPQVVVIGPTPTPLPPTATPLPATDTPVPPSATPTREALARAAVFLPITYASHCSQVPMPLEVALVLDVSASMAAPTQPGGPSKLRAAKDAAEAFVATLRTQDRAAVVTFDAEVRSITNLSGDHAATREVIERLGTGSGTRIDLGLSAGQRVLADRRAGSAPVLVLLTDGRPSTTTANVRQAAESAHAAGITVYAIGLGQDVDAELLRYVAGDEGRYFFAPSTADLQPAFDALQGLTEVVCQ